MELLWNLRAAKSSETEQSKPKNCLNLPDVLSLLNLDAGFGACEWPITFPMLNLFAGFGHGPT